MNGRHQDQVKVPANFCAYNVQEQTCELLRLASLQSITFLVSINHASIVYQSCNDSSSNLTRSSLHRSKVDTGSLFPSSYTYNPNPTIAVHPFQFRGTFPSKVSTSSMINTTPDPKPPASRTRRRLSGLHIPNPPGQLCQALLRPLSNAFC